MKRSSSLIHQLAIASALVAVFCLLGCAQKNDPLLNHFHKESGPLVLRGVSIVDVRQGRTQDGMDILIERGRIQDIRHSIDAKPWPAARNVDARGEFLVPGFVDMHVHVLGEPHLVENLALMLSYGITGFRQMSGSDDLLRERRSSAGIVPAGAPRLLALPGAVVTPLNARNTEAATDLVQSQHAAGANFIKVGLVGAGAFSAVLATAEKLGLPIAGHVPPGVGAGSPEILRMRSIEHLGAMNALALACSTNAAELGANATPKWLDKLASLPFEIPYADEILFFLIRDKLINPIVGLSQGGLAELQVTYDTFDPVHCEQIARSFAAADVWHVPTLINTKGHYLADSEAFVASPVLRYMDPEFVKRWRKVTARFTSDFDGKAKAVLSKTYQREVELVKMLDAAGVSLMTGSDGGVVPPGFKLHGEFDELENAGLSPLKVLQMTTLNPAVFLGEDHVWGAVEHGMRADLVVLSGNPLESVQNLHKINAVVLGGAYYSEADLMALRDAVASRFAGEAVE